MGTAGAQRRGGGGGTGPFGAPPPPKPRGPALLRRTAPQVEQETQEQDVPIFTIEVNQEEEHYPDLKAVEAKIMSGNDLNTPLKVCPPGGRGVCGGAAPPPPPSPPPPPAGRVRHLRPLGPAAPSPLGPMQPPPPPTPHTKWGVGNAPGVTARRVPQTLSVDRLGVSRRAPWRRACRCLDHPQPRVEGRGGGVRRGKGHGGGHERRTPQSPRRTARPQPPPPPPFLIPAPPQVTLKSVLELANPRMDSECASGCPWSAARATAPSPGRPTPGVVKQDKSSGGSIDTTKTRSGPRRVRMCGGERPIGYARGKQSDTEALCQPPPPPHTHKDPRLTHPG